MKTIPSNNTIQEGILVLEHENGIRELIAIPKNKLKKLRKYVKKISSKSSDINRRGTSAYVNKKD